MSPVCPVSRVERLRPQASGSLVTLVRGRPWPWSLPKYEMRRRTPGTVSIADHQKTGGFHLDLSAGTARGGEWEGEVKLKLDGGVQY